MTQPVTRKTGLNALLTPQESVLVLIDHQPFQFANLHSHEPTMIVNNVIGLAKAAKAFNVPTILTTVVEDRGGRLIKGLQDVFPDQKPIDRTWINTWEDARVVDVVKKTGRKKLVMAALWTEVCLAMPAIQAAGEATRCMPRLMPPATSVPKRTRWPSAAWSWPASFRSRGWRSRVNCSATGRVKSRRPRWPEFSLSMAAEPRSRWLGSFSFSVKRRAPEHSPAHCAPKKHTQPVWSTS